MDRDPLSNSWQTDIEDRVFVRETLAILEAEFRELILLALSDWQSLGIVSPNLFSALAMLQRPSWGTWNGILQALQKTVKELSGRDQKQREQIGRATILNAVLRFLKTEV